MLPHDERVAFEVVHVVHRLLWSEFEKKPADVSPEEPLRDVVWIVVVVHVFVVFAVIGGPIKGGVFKCAGAENQSRQFDRCARLEGKVREETMISERYTQAGGNEKGEEETDLKPIKAIVPDVKRNGGDGQCVDYGEENAGLPVDAIPRDSRNEWYLHEDKANN